MLRSILLDGFRSFEGNPALTLAPLTLFAGPNNVGKSSVIQALLALVQSEQAQSGDALQLNGLWCELGGFDQVLNAGRPSDQRFFSMGIISELRSGIVLDSLWRFGPPEDPEQPSALVLEVEYSSKHASRDVVGSMSRGTDQGFSWSQEVIDHEAQRNTEFAGTAAFMHPGSVRAYAMNAEALGNPSAPRVYPMVPFDLTSIEAARTYHIGPYRAPPQPLYTPRASPLGPPLGRYGEHTAEHLFRNRTQRTDILPPGREADGEPQPLLSAVNAWWSYIFDGSLALQIDAPARLGYTLAIDTPSAERLGLGQVGLGLSQSLPIIAACLSSKPGDLVLVETPEAHLHPGAQHRLTSLFIELARRGRQVVVETHSEHLVHAVYLAVKSGMSPEQVSIIFFEQQDGRTAARPIELDPRGRALQAPRGFFDQASIDLAELLR